MSRHPIADQAMSPAERQARRLAKLKAAAARPPEPGDSIALWPAKPPDSASLRLTHIVMDPARTGAWLARILDPDTAEKFRDAFSKALRR